MAPALRAAHPDSTSGDELWPRPLVAGEGVPSWFVQVFGDAGGVLELVPAPPSPGVIFTLSQVKLWRGRGTGDAIISCDISPRGGACWDDGATPRPTAGDQGCSMPSPPPQPGTRDGGRSLVFPGSSRTFGPYPGALRPRLLLCSLLRARERRFPGAGEHGGGGWGGGRGEREGDLTAATAHFTACHALMAEEIKAGMELFIEINQSPRRRGENNTASSVIPGPRAAARPRGGCRRKCPGSARFCKEVLPGLAQEQPSWGRAAASSLGVSRGQS